MNVRLSRAAGEDVVEIVARLERRRAGWGDDFEALMRQAVLAIGTNPRLYGRTTDGPDEPENRDYFIARFEYRVLYVIWNEEAVIVAVRHARQRPGSWVTRIPDVTNHEDPR